jgi:hypothetical protein
VTVACGISVINAVQAGVSRSEFFSKSKMWKTRAETPAYDLPVPVSPRLVELRRKKAVDKAAGFPPPGLEN